MTNYQQFRTLKSNACNMVGRPQKGMRQPQREILDFPHWFLQGVRRQEAKGATFEFLNGGLVRIQWPGRDAILRTREDFKREYDAIYGNGLFEEGAGICEVA